MEGSLTANSTVVHYVGIFKDIITNFLSVLNEQREFKKVEIKKGKTVHKIIKKKLYLCTPIQGHALQIADKQINIILSIHNICQLQF